MEDEYDHVVSILQNQWSHPTVPLPEIMNGNVAKPKQGVEISGITDRTQIEYPTNAKYLQFTTTPFILDCFCDNKTRGIIIRDHIDSIFARYTEEGYKIRLDSRHDFKEMNGKFVIEISGTVKNFKSF